MKPEFCSGGYIIRTFTNSREFSYSFRWYVLRNYKPYI